MNKSLFTFAKGVFMRGVWMTFAKLFTPKPTIPLVTENPLLCITCHSPRPDPWMPCEWCGEVE